MACGGELARTCPSCGERALVQARFCGECGAALDAAAPATPVRPAAAPTSVASGRYQVKRFLGEGAKKRVYLAHDERLDRDVAVALIKTEGLDAAGRTRVRREAQAMGRLGDHPQIVTVFDIGDGDDELYIVSEYMGGGDLEARLQAAEQHRLPVAEALRVAGEICDALEHAHARGVIHRDLKPGNIWLGADGSARLGDFGLALSLDRSRLTQEGMMVGTVAYMAPEQALGRSADARSDLYGLGATLYEMVAGRPPFLGDDAVAVISQHINTAPVAPSWHNPDVGRELEALILKLLAKDADERPESAQVTREALSRVATAPTDAAAARDRSDANPLDRLASGVFVGRDRELEQLRSAFDDALSGQGRVLMLVGEPGIGKTRTSEELATYARMRGAQTLWGRCYEGEGAPAYWPWVQIIRAWVHERDPATLMSEMGSGAADIAEVVSEVRELLPGLPKPPELDPEQARFRLFDSVTSFMRNASRQQPLVLIVDDLHWADKPSLLLLEFLARELGPARLLLVGTYRDVELGRQHPLEQTLAELARSQLSNRVLLRGLTQADVARFVELSAGRAPPDALVEAVYRETEGNPFFVHEVVQLLQSDGRLDDPAAVESWSVEIPQGVRQVIGRRLSSLSDECNRVLAIASVIGREFELPVLAQVSELADDALLELLEAAEDARILQELADARDGYRFSHALIRETLYGELRTTRRLRLHRRVAEAIEALHAEKLEPRLAELAYHLCEAASGGDVQKAVGYAVRAAEREARLLAYEEAANHYERALTALEAADPVDPKRRCELLIALGRAQYRSGTLPQHRQTFARAAELARELGSAEQFAHAALGMGGGWIGSASFVDEELVRIFEEALGLLPEGDGALRARLMARLATELVWQQPGGRRPELIRNATAMARRLGDPGALSWALNAANFTLGAIDEPEAALARCDEIVAVARESGHRSAELEGHFSRSYALIRLGDADPIDRHLEEVSALAAELRQPTSLAQVGTLCSNRALWRGELAEARHWSWESRLQLLRVDPNAAAQGYGLHHWGMRRLQGRLGETLPLLLAGVERFPKVVVWRCLLCCTYSESGQQEQARAVFEDLAHDGFSELQLTGTGFDIGLLSDCCAALGDAERAERLCSLLDRQPGSYLAIGPNLTAGSIARARGLLYATMGRADQAIGHFEDALEADRRMRARGWLPRTQCDYARVLIERDAPGDRERALELLGESLDTSQELGLTAWLDLALALKLRAQGIHPGSASSSIDLVSASIRNRRPDLVAHTAPDGTVTLMFSDVEGFTAMTERLGDRRAHAIISRHNAIVREQLAHHGGRELELQGDGFLLSFASPLQALHCAIGIQRGFAAYNDAHADEPIRVRIGLHTGEAIKDADKFFGLTVILAARIAAQAKGGQILVSAALRALTDQDADLRFGRSRDAALKGISEKQRLVEVDWA